MKTPNPPVEPTARHRSLLPEISKRKFKVSQRGLRRGNTTALHETSGISEWQAVSLNIHNLQQYWDELYEAALEIIGKSADAID